jgi:Protein of unknown function (DUF1059)
MRAFRLIDAGVDCDCDEVIRGETDDEVMQRAAEVAIKHGVDPNDPEFREKVQNLINND